MMQMPCQRRPGKRLLDLYLASGVLDLRGDRLGLLLADALLDRLGGAVDEVLGLLEAEAGELANGLDHVDLGVAGAGEDDRELALLFGGGGVATGGTSGR